MLKQPGAHLPRDQIVRGIRSHASRVRPRVTLTNPLVILRRPQRDRLHPVTHREERDLRPGEQLLQHHAGRGHPEQLAREHLLRYMWSVLLRRAEDHALARRKAIHLHDQASHKAG